MRAALFYRPDLLCERLAQEFSKRRRLRRLRGTCASGLTRDHIDSLELIEMVAQGGARVFYDVGANVGTWSLLCRALVPESEIVAFEPMAGHVEQFRQNTRGMNRIRLFPQALGAQRETREFHPTTFSDASSFLPLNKAGEATWHFMNEAAYPLELVTLDSIVEDQELPWPDLLKLDVQGFELEVLRGAKHCLKHARWILSEVSFRSFYDDQVLFSGLAGYLAAHEFEVQAFGYSMRAVAPLNQVDVLFRRL